MLHGPSDRLAFSAPFIDAIADDDTPVVLVDAARRDTNIAGMAWLAAAMASGSGRTPRLTSRCRSRGSQTSAGATGLTIAKTSEAELFLSAGIRSVTIAHPLINPARIRRAIRTADDRGAEVRFIADSNVGVDALASVARADGRSLPDYLKVDVGRHRSGVDPDGRSHRPRPRLSAENGLRFAGLLSHAGHAYRLLDGA